MRIISKILFFLPFLVLSGFLYISTKSMNFVSYNGAFITASITIAIFSINFSFLQLQNNRYKLLQNKISIQQLFFSIITLFISLLPLITLAINEKIVAAASFISFPLLAYSSILLWQISYDTVNPKLIISRFNTDWNIRCYLKRFNKESIKKQKYLKKYDDRIPAETPMHDLGSSKFATIYVKNDPFFTIRNICALSLENADLSIFIFSVESYFDLIEKYLEIEKEKKIDSRFKLYQHIEYNLSSIFNNVIGENAKGDFQNKLIEVSTIFFKKGCEDNHQTHELIDKLMNAQFNFSMKIIEDGNFSGAKIFTSTCRYMIQKGILNPPIQNDKSDEYFLFNENLPYYANYIKELGSKSIELNNSDFLYRCLEDIGYLGCTGVKNNDYGTGKLALQYIVQLGRESRAKKMRCFWTHCALEPWEHAHERIWWLLSWVGSLDEKEHQAWLDVFEIGYSRILGKKVELSTKKIDNKTTFEINILDEIYTERFSTNSYYKTIDYSNFNELKELTIW